MANLRSHNGTFAIRFRYRGKDYQRSLKTRDPKTARLGLQQLEQRLTLVRMGLLSVPLSVDVGDFFVQGTAISRPTDAFSGPSGGDHSSPLASPRPRLHEASNSPKLCEAIEDYLTSAASRQEPIDSRV